LNRIEAVLSWVPDADLKRAAEGTQLHMASHVTNAATGQVILFDGPRAEIGLGPNGDLCVLPLPAAECCRYHVQIEPVVELRFWASDRGYGTLNLECERLPDGTISIECPATGQRHLVEPAGNRPFCIDSEFFGAGDSERCVEIPWALGRVGGAKRVLDVGYANAEPRYIEARNACALPFVAGLDLGACAQHGISAVVGDATRPPFRAGAFDLILALSVIEHIGRDNSRYFSGDRPPDLFGDIDAGARLSALLCHGGRFLITLPFGRLEDHGWFIQYDAARTAMLVSATRCKLTATEYYGHAPSGWYGPVDPTALRHCRYGTSHAGAVACLELTRFSD
jgi:hypothetical protein